MFVKWYIANKFSLAMYECDDKKLYGKLCPTLDEKKSETN